MDKKELNLIIQKKEGQFIEFKETVDKSLPKEIVAFANASGGRILIGIDDFGNIKGVNITNQIKSEIQNIARNCDPQVKIDFEEHENVLIINVEEGGNKPYSCKEGFYMRMGPNSQKISRDEILKLAIKGGKIRFDEQICSNFDWNDFDDEKFSYYLKLAGISYNLSREEILKNLKVLNTDGFTNAGVLFFAKEPNKYIITSKIRCVHFLGDERVDILDKKEVDRGIVGNIEFAINYLKQLVPVKYKIEKLARDEFPAFPETAYRESIVNALVHFDYFEGSEIAIEKLKNHIIITNKGELLFDEKFFGKRSELRNRLLADLLSRTEYMERVGTGIKRIKESCRKNGNRVYFSYSDSFFVEISRGAQDEAQDKAQDKAQVRKKILMALRIKPLSTSEILKKSGLKSRSGYFKKTISQLVSEGLIEQTIPKKPNSPNQKYKLTKKGFDVLR